MTTTLRARIFSPDRLLYAEDMMPKKSKTPRRANATRATVTHLTPADLVISRFGGVRATGRALGIDPSTVSKWRKREGGRIPNTSPQLGTDMHVRILEKAREMKIRLSANDLIMGGAA